ncbi:MAG: glycosyltransferase family 2 protein [Gemmatimonadaceae bacterium]
MTSVAVSVISTGEMQKLRPCLESLARQNFDGHLRVVVVCNGDVDGSDAVARDLIPDVTTIVNAERRGFAENHNAALAAIPADFGLTLNPDVILSTNCVRELVRAMHQHPAAGMIGPLLRYPGGAPQPSARQFPRPLGTLLRRTPLRRAFADRIRQSPHYLAPPTASRRVDWLLGACVMVRAAAWKDVAGFDPEFRPLYVEDVDLAWRMWSSGWEVWQAPAAEAYHEHQAATDKVFFDRRTLWHARGMLRFVRKHPGILLSGARPVALSALARH